MLRQMAAEDAPEAAAAELKAKAERHENEVSIHPQSFLATLQIRLNFVKTTLLQGDHGGHKLGFVDFNLFVPLSARFGLARCKLGRNCRAVGQHCGTSKIQ